MKRILWLAAALLITCPPDLLAQESASVEDLVNELEAKMGKMILEKSKQPEEEDSEEEDSRLAQRTLQSAVSFKSSLSAAWKRATSSGDYRAVIQLLDSAAAMNFGTELTGLISKIRKKVEEEQKREIERQSKQIDSFRAKVSDQLLKSKNPEDLDAIIAEATKLHHAFSQYSSSNRTAYAKIDSARNLAVQWQDYLNAKSMGDLNNTRRALSNLASTLSRDSLIPRSHVLKLQNDLTVKPVQASTGQPASLVDPVSILKSLDDLEKSEKLAREQFAADTRTSDKRYRAELLTQALAVKSAIERGRVRESLIKLTSDWNVSSSNLRQTRDWLKGELLALALWHFLSESARESLDPEESFHEHVLHVADALAKEEKWDDLWLILTTYKFTAGGKFSTVQRTILAWVDYDIAGIEKFITAENQLKAGELAAAFHSYQEVIKNPGKFKPVDAAVRRIVELREERSDELAASYSESAKRPLIPPGARTYPMRMYPGHMAAQQMEETVKRLVDERWRTFQALGKALENGGQPGADITTGAEAEAKAKPQQKKEPTARPKPDPEPRNEAPAP